MQKIKTGKLNPQFRYLRIFSAFFYRRVTLPFAIFSTLLLIFYASVIMGRQSRKITESSGGEVEILDLRTGYNATDVEALFLTMGETGLASYRRMVLVWDNIFPMVYTLAYIAWFTILFGSLIPEHSVYRRINMIPLIALLSDWTENTLEVNLIDNFTTHNSINNLLVSVASVSTILKWIIVLLLLAVFGAGLIILLYRLIRGQKAE